MPQHGRTLPSRHRTLLAVTAFQAVAAVFFLVDVVVDLGEQDGRSFHTPLEGLVVLALWSGTFLGLREYLRLRQEARHMQDRLRVASGAFLDLLEDSFGRWGLTPSERDVALLTVKGLSVSEIAALRATREGTVKAQGAAIYRKAGVSGRAQLISYFVEDLMSGLVLEPQLDTAAARRDVALQHGRP